MRLLVAIGVLLCAAPAWADERATNAAAAAANVHAAACPDVASGNISTTPGSLRQVAETWERVSAVYQATGAAYLQYWRGLLGLCLGQQELAVEDLQAFIAMQGDDPSLRSLVEEARRRLRRAGVKPPAAARRGPDPAWIIGGVAGGLALVSGVSSAPVFADVGALRRDLLTAPYATRPELDQQLAQGDRLQGTGIGLLAAAGTLGVTSAVLLISQAAGGSGGGKTTTVTPVPLAVDGRVMPGLGVVGRW